MLGAIAEGRLPEWFESRVRNNGQPLSYYALGLVEADGFGRIDWDREKLAMMAWSASGGSTSGGAAVAGQRAAAVQLESHLKLNENELRELIQKERDDFDAEEVESSVREVQEAFRKVSM